MKRELDRAVLLAPLRMPTTRWSSRSVAESLGVSQSRVARAWASMREETDASRAVEAAVGSAAVGLVGVLVCARYSLLVLEVGPDQGPGALADSYPPPAVHRSLRTILAGELARDVIPDSAASSSSRDAFWSAIARVRPPSGHLLLVCSREAPVPSWLDDRVVCADSQEWLSLFGCLDGARRQVGPERAHAAEAALREWFLAPRGDFTWVATPHPAPGTLTGPGRHLMRSPGAERALADEIVVTIRDAVTDGRLTGGGRVSERYLATRLHTSRAQIRSAMRLLERDGLLTLTSGGTAVLPVPDVDDVIETYAARQALGAMVVRAAVRWSPSQQAAVEAALTAVQRHAAAGDVYLTGLADTTFQDRIADASGLVRIAPVMHILADHLRVFIAVMGLDYAYPVDAIVRDDEAIHAALVAQDPDLATELWRAKMTNARTYMLERLAVGQRRGGARRRGGEEEDDVR